MTKKVNYSNLYTVAFIQGYAGSFLIWFISQHTNFVKLNATYASQTMDKNGKFYNDSSNPRSHIHLSKNSFLPDTEKLKTYINKNFLNSNKKIFKIRPHGFELFNFTEEVKKINIIVIDVENNNWIDKRMQKLSKNNFVFNKQQLLNKVINFENKCKEYNINYIKFDIAKFLNFDENEYHKLLEFIGEKPLDNWQQLIVEYKKTVGID